MHRQLGQTNLASGPVRAICNLNCQLQTRPTISKSLSKVRATPSSSVTTPHLALTLRRTTRHFRSSLTRQLTILRTAIMTVTRNDLARRTHHRTFTRTRGLSKKLDVFNCQTTTAITRTVRRLLRRASKARLASTRLRYCLGTLGRTLDRPRPSSSPSLTKS